MARRPRAFNSLRARIHALMDQQEPVLAQAFLESIAEIKSAVVLAEVIDRLEARDIDGAVRALNIDRAAYAGLDAAITAAYGAGGAATAGAMPALFDRAGGRVVVRFDMRNTRAEGWARQHVGSLITRVTEDQTAAVRTVIGEGIAAGQNPRNLVVDIVGRLNRQTGRREGGILGLSGPQIEYVRNARAELTGDPQAMARYLTRERRDRRFDGLVRRAIQDGKPLDAATTARMVNAYEKKLLALRAETIARTETAEAIHAAKHEAFRQAMEKADYTDQEVIRTWRSAGDTHVRDTHAGMDGQQVRGLDTPFVSPSGALLRYPGDRGLGAGPEEVIGCRCDDDIRFDVFRGRA